MGYLLRLCLATLFVVGSANAQLLEVIPLEQYQPEKCKEILSNYGISSEAPDFPLQRFRVVYRASSNSGRASALVSIPKMNTKPSFSVMYFHGTRLERVRVPSMVGSGAAECLFAANGNPVIAPDYFGMGVDHGMHAYMHKEKTQLATTELLSALFDAKVGSAEMTQLTNKLSKNLVLAGYSQGGYSTLVAMEALEKAKEFPVLAAFPMAGAYDLPGATMKGLLNKPKPHESNLYIAYVTLAYQEIYGNIFEDPKEVFQEDFLDIADLYSGAHPAKKVLSKLPLNPDQLLQKSFYTEITPEGQYKKFYQALQKNSIHHFIPRAPVTLLYSSGDTAVPPANSVNTYKLMKNSGANVTLVDLGAHFNHSTGFAPSMQYVQKKLKGIGTRRSSL